MHRSSRQAPDGNAAAYDRAVAAVSERLQARVRRDFGDDAELVLDRLERLHAEKQSPERYQAAVVLLARGELARLEWAAGIDWRDAFVWSGLGGNWERRLEDELGREETGPPGVGPAESEGPGTTPFLVRQARMEDAPALAELFAAVAGERDRIATEPPVDVDARTRQFAASIEGTIVAVGEGRVVGSLHLQATRFGFADLGMLVARPWRGRGVGSALLAAAVEKARADGLHKLSLGVFPHNAAALALYRKFGFVEEGRLVKHYRRTSGELWDSIVMGRLL
jgi:RimJ/RimL family protein N-acetyltransferase